MKKIQKLVLKKETISNLSYRDLNNLKGGEAFPTAGCTDGCFTGMTLLNCTQANCTADCCTGNACNSFDTDCLTVWGPYCNY